MLIVRAFYLCELLIAGRKMVKNKSQSTLNQTDFHYLQSIHFQ